MTRVAVLGNDLAVPSRVRAVMATETSWKIRVPQVVRVGAPRNLQIRKYVAVIDCKNCPGRLMDVFGALCVEVWIILAIKTSKGGRQFRSRFRTCGVVRL